MLNDIGTRLKKLRQKNNLTQEELAKDLGISSQTVGQWETGAALPDLSYIIPLAKRLHVSTDKLLGYKERRAELEYMWQKAVNKGPQETLKISEAALLEYPHDMTFLYRRACDENFCANQAADEKQKKEYLERSARHFQMLHQQYPDFDSAVGMLIEVLSKLGRYDEAKSYVYDQPGKDHLLKYCLTGDELQRHCQLLAEKALQKLYQELMSCHTLASLQAAEDILGLIFSDGNYLGYYGHLMRIYNERATLFIAQNRYDEAIKSLHKAFQYAKESANLSGKGSLAFTSPVFNKLTFNANFSPIDPVELFCQYTERSEFDCIRGRSDFIEITKGLQ